MTDFCSKASEERQAYCSSLLRYVQDHPGDSYSRLSHITITAVGDGWAEGELTVCPEVLNPMGMVHGGCLATLADTVAGTAAHSGGQRCVTLNCSLNLLKPAKGSRIVCRAVRQKSGRTIQVCEVVLTDEQGAQVMTGTLTFYALGPFEPDSPRGT